MKKLALALILAVAAAGCSDKRVAPAQPGPTWPPDLKKGFVRLSPEADHVRVGGDIVVMVEANSGGAPVGAFSIAVTYNHEAFDLLAVSGEGLDLNEPAHWSEAAPGSVYMAFLNSAEPDETARGLMRIARLRFRAKGQQGEHLNHRGRLLSFGDIEFPARTISAQELPADVERLCGVTIR